MNVAELLAWPIALGLLAFVAFIFRRVLRLSWIAMAVMAIGAVAIQHAGR